MNYRFYDAKYPSRLVMANDQEVQFKDHYADVDPASAYFLSRMWGSEYQIQNQQDKVPFNKDSWTKDKRLIWSCNYASANGYGNVAENTVKYLLQKGIRVLNPGFISNNQVAGGGLVDDVVKESLNKSIYPDCIEIQHCQPPSFRQGIVERSWIYTMFETTHTPQSWIEMMNQSEVVLTPSSWVIPYWREQGLTVPIEVYPHGIDPTVYYYLERPERETYTFLHYAQLSVRKGTDLVAKAFTEEFRGQIDVRLVFKNTIPFFPVPLNLPNVSYISATYNKEQMRQMLLDADCFVFPTRGEGFGLTGIESMATGLPTIITGWSGPTEYIDPKDTLILKHSMVRSPDFDSIYKDFYQPGEDSGYWAEADLDDLKAKMRWCYEHQAEAKAMGMKAAERIANNWSWSQKVDLLTGIIDRHA